MNLLEIILGQIPEAIYFAMFMLLTKELKSKRLAFVIGIIIEYVLILNCLPYSIWSYVLYFVLSFLLLKILYRDKSNITDVFTLGIASLFMVISSFVLYVIIYFTIHNMIIYVLLHRIILLISMLLFKNKLPSICNLYEKLWNRSKHSYRMKSTTFRALNLVIFNLSFVVMNLGVIFYYCWR
jgi:hypothetical protein